eukprot:gene19239-biopygen22023
MLKNTSSAFFWRLRREALLHLFCVCSAQFLHFLSAPAVRLKRLTVSGGGLWRYTILVEHNLCLAWMSAADAPAESSRRGFRAPDKVPGVRGRAVQRAAPSRAVHLRWGELLMLCRARRLGHQGALMHCLPLWRKGGQTAIQMSIVLLFPSKVADLPGLCLCGARICGLLSKRGVQLPYEGIRKKKKHSASRNARDERKLIPSETAKKNAALQRTTSFVVRHAFQRSHPWGAGSEQHCNKFAVLRRSECDLAITARLLFNFLCPIEKRDRKNARPQTPLVFRSGGVGDQSPPPCPVLPCPWEKRQRTQIGRGPDAGRTTEFKETDADRMRTGRGQQCFSLCPGRNSPARVRSASAFAFPVPCPVGMRISCVGA